MAVRLDRQSHRPTQTWPLRVCDAGEALFGQNAPSVLTCLFGTLQSPQLGVCPIRQLFFYTNEPGVSMKTQDRCRKSAEFGTDLQVSS